MTKKRTLEAMELLLGPRSCRLARAMEELDVMEEPANPAIDIAERIERGQFTAKSVRELLDQITESRPLAVAAVFRALGARRWFADLVTRKRIFEPDYKTQLEAAKLLFSYQDGLPLQTVLTANAGDGGKSSLRALRDAARESPAVREALREMLDELERPALTS